MEIEVTRSMKQESHHFSGMKFKGLYAVLLVLLGIILDRYVFPILDVLLEFLTIKITNRATKVQLNTETDKMEFNIKYGKDEEQVITNATGFDSASSEFLETFNEEEDDEADDDENKK